MKIKTIRVNKSLTQEIKDSHIWKKTEYMLEAELSDGETPSEIKANLERTIDSWLGAARDLSEYLRETENNDQIVDPFYPTMKPKCGDCGKEIKHKRGGTLK